MFTQCEQALELISAALDGELTPAERAALDAHLNECPACAALFDELAGHARLLRQLDCQPPGDLTERILSRLPEQTPEKRSGLRRWARWGSLAACAALAIWAGTALPGSAPKQTSDNTADNNSQMESLETTDTASSIPDFAFLSPEDDLQPHSGDEAALSGEDSVSMNGSGPAAPEIRSSDQSSKDVLYSPNSSAAASAQTAPGSVQYLRTTWIGEPSAPTAQLLNTYTELTDCLAQYPEDDFSSVAEAYDAAYFETACLVAVTIEESSGSAALQVESVSATESGYQVTIRQETPETATDDTASWLILIEAEPLQEALEEVALIIQD